MIDLCPNGTIPWDIELVQDSLLTMELYSGTDLPPTYAGHIFLNVSGTYKTEDGQKTQGPENLKV